MKINFRFGYLITKYDWCFYAIPNLVVWKPYDGVYEFSVGFLFWELNVAIKSSL